ATTLAGSAAALAVVFARGAIRRWFGAQIAYLAWIVVPAVAAAALLPAPLVPGAVLRLAATGAAHPGLGAFGAGAPAFDPRPVLLGLWIAGVALTLFAFVAAERRYRRRLGRVRAHGAARVVRGGVDDGPALVGAVRPRVVLPCDFGARYTPPQRRLILAHERTHLGRGDTRINAFVAALRCLNWFNPLIHFAAAKFRLDQELACDAAVIARFPHERRHYAEAMLSAQLAGAARPAPPAGCGWPSGHPLKERIAMLKQPLPTRRRRGAGALLVAALCACGGYLAWTAQPARAAAERAAGVDVRLALHRAGRDAVPVEVTADAVRVAGRIIADAATKPRLADGTLFVEYGRPLRIAYGAAAERWTVTLTAEPHDADTLVAHVVLAHADRVVSRPELIVRDDVPARVAISGDADDAFDLAVTLARRSGAERGGELADPDAAPRP
ncbi:MAG TPA: M56 family metallopeptidase, partial [Dokdonella sp.]